MQSLNYSGHLFLSFQPTITAYMGTFQCLAGSQVPAPPDGVEIDLTLEHCSWALDRACMDAIGRRFQSHGSRTRRMLVVNTHGEDGWREQAGVSGFFCPEHIFQPDQVFVPQDLTIEYDAIYVARLAGFKRHGLARKVDRLRVLTGGAGEATLESGLEPVADDHHGFGEELQGKSVSLDLLNKTQVCEEINRSRCGLALSAVEGAMRASTEYLLCGTPVVSTRSTGGRDVFYNKGNSIIVEDNPDAVLAGVRYWMENPPDKLRIRSDVLRQLNTCRYRYAQKVSELQSKLGGTPEVPERIFQDLFVSRDADRRRFIASGKSLDSSDLAARFSYPDKEVRFQRNPEFSILRSDDGRLLSGRENQYRLNHAAALVFGLLDGTRRVDEIIRILRTRYGKGPDLEFQIRNAIADLLDRDALRVITEP